MHREPVGKVRSKTWRRIWGYGVLVVAAIVLSALLGDFPLRESRAESRRVGVVDRALQQVADLRTNLADWQMYLEPRFQLFTPIGAYLDPVDLAKGSTLAQNLTNQAVRAVKALRGVPLDRVATDVESQNAALLKTFTALAPLAAGAKPAAISAAIASERAAFLRVWGVTATATAQLTDDSARELARSAQHLEDSRKTGLVIGIAGSVLALGAAVTLGRRARRRERSERAVAERRTFETMMQHALEMSKTEPDVYGILYEALAASVPNLQVEMLVADSSRAHFHRALTTTTASDESPRAGCRVVSPLDCPATRRGHTLVFPTSRALDACPHLKGRPSGDLSAVCVAISLSGKTVGVLHATGPDDVVPDETDIRYLEITSRRVSERVAMLRAFEKSEAQARSDPLTGLWNRRSLENRVHELHRDAIPYALAYGDLDHFKELNDTHGHDAGDQALRLFSRVMRDSIRPNDIAARYGGEEFVIVLPDCSPDAATHVLERLRERLALTLTTGRVPAFTASFGLAASTDAETFDAVVAVADGALLKAKADGRNRVVLASRGGAGVRHRPSQLTDGSIGVGRSACGEALDHVRGEARDLTDRRQ